MVRRAFASLGFTLATMASCLVGASGFRAQILPDVRQQIDYARQCEQNGSYSAALAHADLILFDREIKVFVSTDEIDLAQVGTCLSALDGAADMWEKALDQEIRFKPVDREADADIVVKFQRSVVSNGVEVGGTVNWRRSIGCSRNPVAQVHGDIFIRTDCPCGAQMNYDQMRHVAGHEIGHVLGLGDADQVGTIMGPIDLNKPALTLSIDEIQALREIREEAANLRRDILMKAVGTR